MFSNKVKCDKRSLQDCLAIYSCKLQFQQWLTGVDTFTRFTARIAYVI